METWTRRACRQRAFRQLWLWAIVTGAIAFCFYGSVTYWKNFFYGPYQMSEAELAGPTDPAKEFIGVTGDKVFSSGVQMITTETRNGVKENSYVAYEYYLLVIGKSRMLIVQSKGSPPLDVQGEVKPTPMSVVDKIFASSEDADLKSRLYPFYLSTIDDYRSPGYFGLGCTTLYLIALSFFFRRAWRYARNPALHPVVRRVESWSNSMEVAMMSEREMEQSVRFKRAGIVITDNFLIERGLLSFNIFQLDHLLWAYKKVTTRSINFIPVGQTTAAVFVFYGGSVTLPWGKKPVDEVLTYATNRAPWAFMGYSEELKKAFKADVRGFCAAVEKRRAAL